ncbi:STAS domain-containing protein [bacterium]|nr:STAS domain-containing protein [bacterium]
MATIEVIKNAPDTKKNSQTVFLKGEIDRDTIAKLREAMETILPTLETKTLIIDLENLKFINSEGIGYLTDIHNRLNTLGKNVVILKASARIMDIFQLVGLNQIVSCYATEEEMNSDIKS